MVKHDSFLCPPHVDDCDCDDKVNTVCNPYCVLGYCPTDGAGDECQADPSQLEKVPSGIGFTWAFKKGAER